MQRYTFNELTDLFSDYTSKHDYVSKPIYAVAVFKQDIFNKPQTLAGRSYVFSCVNKMFEHGMIGYSCFATCVEDLKKSPWEQDTMRIEHMGADIEYCYLSDKDGQPIKKDTPKLKK